MAATSCSRPTATGGTVCGSPTWTAPCRGSSTPAGTAPCRQPGRPDVRPGPESFYSIPSHAWSQEDTHHEVEPPHHRAVAGRDPGDRWGRLRQEAGRDQPG